MFACFKVSLSISSLVWVPFPMSVKVITSKFLVILVIAIAICIGLVQRTEWDL